MTPLTQSQQQEDMDRVNPREYQLAVWPRRVVEITWPWRNEAEAENV